LPTALASSAAAGLGKLAPISRTKAEAARLIAQAKDDKIMRQALLAAFTGLLQAADIR
jgi:hypothetical protein